MDSRYHRGLAIPADQVDYLLAAAGRAPSVHNTQPWQFRIGADKVELFADPRRKLRTDPAGREMLISCGGALFGLRLAIRSLGYRPVVRLLPDPSQLALLASVSLRPGPPMSHVERVMLDAVPHRHTHRGPFTDRSLPPGLVAALQQDALAEGAALALVRDPTEYGTLAGVASRAAVAADLDRVARDEISRWTRLPGSQAADGIPARAFRSGHLQEPGRLRQRGFDLGRGIGAAASGGSDPVATAVLVTFGDRDVNWLQAGQALQRILLRAASDWVYASLYSQPIESAGVRELIARRLALPGSPQMLLQFGRVEVCEPTSRRPANALRRS
jgi:hypothetical protein